jgi:putative FmdB family regulatory protein
MPIYEYVCTKCLKTFEIVHGSFNAKQFAKCRCGHKAKRIVSQSTFRLKGTGWPGITAGKLEGGGSGVD